VNPDFKRFDPARLVVYRGLLVDSFAVGMSLQSGSDPLKTIILFGISVILM
jgi:hypothetical protein